MRPVSARNCSGAGEKNRALCAAPTCAVAGAAAVAVVSSGAVPGGRGEGAEKGEGWGPERVVPQPSGSTDIFLHE